MKTDASPKPIQILGNPAGEVSAVLMDDGKMYRRIRAPNDMNTGPGHREKYIYQPILAPGEE